MTGRNVYVLWAVLSLIGAMGGFLVGLVFVAVWEWRNARTDQSVLTV